MTAFRVFVSRVQREFAAERTAAERETRPGRAGTGPGQTPAAARRPFAGDVPRGFQESVSDGVRIVADGADRFRVLTPFQFDDGDHLVIVLKKKGAGWVLSDEAHTFMHLAQDGDESDLHEGACAPIVSGILSRFGVEARGGELVVAVPDDGRGDAVCAFVQALIEIQALATFDRRTRADGSEDGAAIRRVRTPTERERREGR